MLFYILNIIENKNESAYNKSSRPHTNWSEWVWTSSLIIAVFGLRAVLAVIVPKIRRDMR
ncbi:hypothetical protein B4113_0518 [Geobacillus sp. B4113_201601]|nr:hypothetical protein B4113_0518 [Geobacillus sp. B4113_201601]